MFSTKQCLILTNALGTKAFLLQNLPQDNSCSYSIHWQTVKQLKPLHFIILFLLWFSLFCMFGLLDFHVMMYKQITIDNH